MGSRATKPTVIKMMEGAYDKDPQRFNKNEPKPKVAIPKKEKYLCPRAKKVFNNLAPRLAKLGLLTETDDQMFNALCQLIVRVQEVSDEVNDLDKKTIVDSNGNIRTHPACGLETKYLDKLRQYASEFGLSPRGRCGLSVGKTELVDSFDELLD